MRAPAIAPRDQAGQGGVHRPGGGRVGCLRTSAGHEHHVRRVRQRLERPVGEQVAGDSVDAGRLEGRGAPRIAEARHRGHPAVRLSRGVQAPSGQAAEAVAQLAARAQNEQVAGQAGQRGHGPRVGRLRYSSRAASDSGDSSGRRPVRPRRSAAGRRPGRAGGLHRGTPARRSRAAVPAGDDTRLVDRGVRLGGGAALRVGELDMDCSGLATANPEQITLITCQSSVRDGLLWVGHCQPRANHFDDLLARGKAAAAGLAKAAQPDDGADRRQTAQDEHHAVRLGNDRYAGINGRGRDRWRHLDGRRARAPGPGRPRRAAAPGPPLPGAVLVPGTGTGWRGGGGGGSGWPPGPPGPGPPGPGPPR